MIIQKWGNSAAIRLPVELLKSLNVKVGDELQTKVSGNELIVRKAGRPKYLLEDLMAEEQGQPLQGEGWCSEPAVGSEIW
ncbi:AbrB/MazE/SpoVT family DNA-binding domain-containing protein [Neisseria leonii]|uniref:AbrB/MazE/SpoVT family DNA-binding domain-containing protein n=1 Tax=Neisseria leonii TaxID=2995413 RepID=A0A9X4E1A3_9NEIS|nr:AbrB/MazE/SpoVT family DNA-binding domain-containing protein [Neisseria sp. 51.81]MDD9326730.1 AbrB/MazE/SpoVT family DNA-binding domain-containing protein [Neisseria sp. 51.81]